MLAEANLANRHHVFESIYCVGQCTQEHTQHCAFVDWHGSKAADNIDREDGTKMSWTEALASLDSATAIPTCGSEEAVLGSRLLVAEFTNYIGEIVHMYRRAILTSYT